MFLIADDVLVWMLVELLPEIFRDIVQVAHANYSGGHLRKRKVSSR